ncbi:quinohemoprotein amine dehydrogenase subunit alpha [Caenispirillum salinarum]|uniref:quinohemoprotein amine dehydrogenase subunit alpha n=1 Tax=Caenispirillum salinarum TaxID=859058 RepID=UPI0005B98375
MRLTVLSGALLVGALALVPSAQAADGPALLEAKCASCHAENGDGTYTRIDAGRRTPEGWLMTLVRMERNHDVKLTAEERRTLVRHLADTRGLSVAETEGSRYILEKNPIAWDEGPTQEMTEMCSRCHSWARVALQRRTKEDWAKLMHFHLGQFPTAEYQALARDRAWWDIAQNQMVDELAERFPLGKAPEASTADLSGTWSVAGVQRGQGPYHGTMTVSPKDGGMLDVMVDLTYENGTEVTQAGTGMLYGAGEWRASLTGAGTQLRQVMALSEDGETLTGRWFDADQDVIGGAMTAVKTDADPRVIAVAPSHLRQGATTRVTVAGVGLNGDPDFGEGVTATVVERTPEMMVLDVAADSAAQAGPRDVSIGGQSMDDAFVVYDGIDRLTVEPAVTFARVGGNGGPIPKVPAQFEAIGWMNGPDGQPNTEDDIRIGAMPAEWKTDNFDATAAALDDAKYAGQIGDGGLFVPGPAGPNPARVKGTNNVGNLSVIASVFDGGREVEATGQLYVTVQRFVDPPIR